jgi:hypothetical protein
MPKHPEDYVAAAVQRIRDFAHSAGELVDPFTLTAINAELKSIYDNQKFKDLLNGTPAKPTMKPIVWKRGAYGTQTGYIDNIKVFSISENLFDPKEGRLKLNTLLPGIKTAHYETDEECKKAATDMCEQFIGKFFVTP